MATHPTTATTLPRITGNFFRYHAFSINVRFRNIYFLKLIHSGRPPPLNHVRPGSELNLDSLPMPLATVAPRKMKGGFERTLHSTALVQLVGKKE